MSGMTASDLNLVNIASQATGQQPVCNWLVKQTQYRSGRVMKISTGSISDSRQDYNTKLKIYKTCNEPMLTQKKSPAGHRPVASFQPSL